MSIYFLSTWYCACYIILKAGDIFHTFSGVIFDVLPCTCAQESFNNNIKYETQKAMSSITVSLTYRKVPVFWIAVVVLLLDCHCLPLRHEHSNRHVWKAKERGKPKGCWEESFKGSSFHSQSVTDSSISLGFLSHTVLQPVKQLL